ncbi:hypothetical protein HDU85_000721 [Gaertneriomyces sp. JEL0708]|nr:hypothetical protein HDU85_000721 [Gaertneriomyces sp. JEL0708]
MTEYCEDNGFVFRPAGRRKVRSNKDTQQREPPAETSHSKLPPPTGPLKLKTPITNRRRSNIQPAIDYASPAVSPVTSAQDVERRRRTSVGLRGRRVSHSTNGLCPNPHETIPPATFYRHINADLPDPQRMLQLLLWCASRTKSQRPTTTQLSPELYRVFQDCQNRVIKQLAERRINVSWYNREPRDEDAVKTKVLPHPRNIENARALVDHQRDMARLRKEEQIWVDLLNSLNRQREESALQLPQVLETVPASFRIDETPTGDYHTECAIAMQQLCDDASVKQVGDDMNAEFWAGRTAIDELQFVFDRVSAHTKRMQRETDEVFERILQVYEEREKRKRVGVDPMDLLQLLAGTRQ